LVTVEVIKHGLIYAAEEMGIALRNSAYSPNIKERQDHSCSLFDAQERLIAQAEHIPVHLGSLPQGLRDSLRSLREAGRELVPGDMLVVNNPYVAGTHLNDITLIRPVFYSDELVGYVANKAHHADIGGRVPGSIAPDSLELHEEGVIIPVVKLMSRDQVNDDLMAIICHNSRNPQVCLGDLRAQIAANLTGERRLLDLLQRYGLETYTVSVDRILSDSEIRLRQVIHEFPDGTYHAEDYLDHGGRDRGPVRLQVAVTITGSDVVFDYEGTDPQVEGALNAPLGVTLSGVFFVVRAVTDPTIPMNEGCFEPATVRAPLGTVLNPRFPCAVAGGNVETSMRNADLLLRAFAQICPEKICAACGGTMTNLMAGGPIDGSDGFWAYYETVGTGMGACHGADGVDGIHCNMTNTLNTPIESLEHNYPLRMTRYEFRENSGGAGQWRGGCGIVRSWSLEGDRATFTVLSERSRYAPWGLEGGLDGEKAEHWLVRDGERVRFESKATVELRRGDEVVIQTPGGGGYGPPEERESAAVIEDVGKGLVSRDSACGVYGLTLADGMIDANLGDV
jgi:N-methylhydantoinase B